MPAARRLGLRSALRLVAAFALSACATPAPVVKAPRAPATKAESKRADAKRAEAKRAKAEERPEPEPEPKRGSDPGPRSDPKPDPGDGEPDLAALQAEVSTPPRREGACRGAERGAAAAAGGLIWPVDGVVISGEVGLYKPQPEIFRLGAERVGLAPAECVFVDDLRENCEGAEAVGMTAVLHRGADASLERLEELLDISLR